MKRIKYLIILSFSVILITLINFTSCHNNNSGSNAGEVHNVAFNIFSLANPNQGIPNVSITIGNSTPMISNIQGQLNINSNDIEGQNLVFSGLLFQQFTCNIVNSTKLKSVSVFLADSGNPPDTINNNFISGFVHNSTNTLTAGYQVSESPTAIPTAVQNFTIQDNTNGAFSFSLGNRFESNLVISSSSNTHVTFNLSGLNDTSRIDVVMDTSMPSDTTRRPQ